MSLKSIPIQLFELTEGGYVLSLSYQKGKEMRSFSKFAADSTELGKLLEETTKVWDRRHEPEPEPE